MDYLSPGDVLHAYNDDLGDVGMRQQMSLYVERADLVTAALDYVDRRTAEYSVRAVVIDSRVTWTNQSINQNTFV